MKTIFTLFLSCFMLIAAFAQQDASVTQMTLEESIKYAIENSYDMSYADMDVRAARSRNKELTAIGLPQINGDVSFNNYLELPTTVLPANAFRPDAPEGELIGVQFGTEYNATASLRASQLIFDGTYFIGLKAAKKYTELNKHARQQTENEIRKSITEAYGLAVLSIQSHNILNENYASLEGLLNETEKMFEAGFREELDVDQLRLQLASLGNNRVQAERNVEITHNLLKFQMGMPVSQEVVLTSEIEELADVSYMPQMLEREVTLDNHTDILTAQSNVELRQLNVRVERMAGVPNLGATFTTQQQAFRNDFDFFDSEGEWFPNTFWGLKLNVPIFSGFQRYNKVQQARIDVERAQRQLDQARESIHLEVARQKSNFASAMEIFNTEKENLELAEKINNTTRRKYQEGLSSSFEIQQAESQLLNAQNSYLRAAYDVVSARAALQKSLDIQ